jgi:hypothetical protein
MWSGVQDFTVLYAGARMVGTGQLYNTGDLRAMERELVGTDSPDFHYVRLPIVAGAWKPLTLLSYPRALVLWKALTVLGFVSLVWILPFPPRPVTLIATAVSLGAANTLLLGQDVWLSVLAIAAFVRFQSRGRDGAAGISLGLALILKYHIFPLLILSLLLHRKWRVLSNAAMVAAAAIFLSFVVEGPSWLQAYAHVLLGKGAVLPMYMPNLAGLVTMAGLGLGTYVIMFAAAAMAVFAISRRSSPQFSFGIAVFAGVLVAPHGYLYDYTIFLPALLPLAAKHPWFESHCAWWLMPFPLVPLVTGFSLAGQVIILMTGAATLYAASQFASANVEIRAVSSAG